MHGSPLRHLAVAVTLAAFAAASCAQTLEVAPNSIKLVQVEGGPLAIGKLTIRSSGEPQPWTAVATPENPKEPWLTLSAGNGVTPATLTLGLVNWRGAQQKAGKFHHTVTIKSGASVIAVMRVFKIVVPDTPTVDRIMANCDRLDAFAKADPFKQSGAPS